VARSAQPRRKGGTSYEVHVEQNPNGGGFPMHFATYFCVYL